MGSLKYLIPILIKISLINSTETRTKCVRCYSRAKIYPKYNQTSMSCSNPRNVYDDGAETCLMGPSEDIINQLDYDYIDSGNLRNQIGECEADQFCFYKATKEMVKRGSSESEFGDDNDDFWYFTVDRGCVGGGRENADRFVEDCENDNWKESCNVCEGDRCNLMTTCCGWGQSFSAMLVYGLVFGLFFS